MKFIKIEAWSSDPTVKVLSLNRPEVKNSFHAGMISELATAFTDFNQDKQTKLIVLRGEGDIFCAGADLGWMQSMVNFNLQENLEDSQNLWKMFQAMHDCTTPILAYVQGAVFGGALGLVGLSDYVVAQKETKFCFSEVKLGLAPAVISDFILRKLSDGVVRPLMISAEVFLAGRAQEIGLVHRIVENESEFNQTIQLFTNNGTQAMRATKWMLGELQKISAIEQRQELTTQVISKRRVSVEAQERLKKFLAKK